MPLNLVSRGGFSLFAAVLYCVTTPSFRAYNMSAATLNLLRGFSSGGYGGLTRVSKWNLDFMANSEEGKLYMDLAR